MKKQCKCTVFCFYFFKFLGRVFPRFLNTAGQYMPQAGSAAPFATPVVAGLGTGRLAQYGMDKLGIKNKLLRYPGIGLAAYGGATSAVAPYLAGGTAVYYGAKYGWKYGTKALKGLGNMAKRGLSKLNPFSGTGGPTPAAMVA